MGEIFSQYIRYKNAINHSYVKEVTMVNYIVNPRLITELEFTDNPKLLILVVFFNLFF